MKNSRKEVKLGDPEKLMSEEQQAWDQEEAVSFSRESPALGHTQQAVCGESCWIMADLRRTEKCK